MRRYSPSAAANTSAVTTPRGEFPSLEPRFAWSDVGRKHVVEWKGRMPVPYVEQVAFSADGARLFVPFPSGELLDVDARTGRVRTRWPAHDGCVTCIDVDYAR